MGSFFCVSRNTFVNRVTFICELCYFFVTYETNLTPNIFRKLELDLSKCLGEVGFQRFLIKPEIAKNLYNRKLTQMNLD